MKVESVIGVFYKDPQSLLNWKHNYGDLLMMQKRPNGDRWYVDENSKVTLIKYAQINSVADIEESRGYRFTKVIMLDTYRDEMVSWLKSREHGDNSYESTEAE